MGPGDRAERPDQRERAGLVRRLQLPVGSGHADDLAVQRAGDHRLARAAGLGGGAGPEHAGDRLLVERGLGDGHREADERPRRRRLSDERGDVEQQHGDRAERSVRAVRGAGGDEHQSDGAGEQHHLLLPGVSVRGLGGGHLLRDGAGQRRDGAAVLHEPGEVELHAGGRGGQQAADRRGRRHLLFVQRVTADGAELLDGAVELDGGARGHHVGGAGLGGAGAAERRRQQGLRGRSRGPGVRRGHRGTGASLWVLDTTTGQLVGNPATCPTANSACVNLGDIDTSPNISLFDGGNTLWVGNKAGLVYALNLAQVPGASMLKWTAAVNLGTNNQLKGLVWEDFSTAGRLYMVVADTTTADNHVRCFLDTRVRGA